MDIADAIFILSYLFGDGDSPGCSDAADINADGGIDIADAVSLLSYLMGGGGPPAAPFPSCGVLDPPGSGLGCERFPACD